MRKLANKFIAKYGLRISALAVAIASISPMCCRGEWYQPKEPENLHKIFGQRS